MNNKNLLINVSLTLADKSFFNLSKYLNDILEISSYYNNIYINITNQFFRNVLSNFFFGKDNIIIIDDDYILNMSKNLTLRIELADDNENICDNLNIVKKDNLCSLKHESILVEKMIELINSNGLHISDKSFERSSPLGLGDILFSFVLLNNNIIEYININIATFLVYKNTINYFEFRVNLILDLCKYNNICKSKIIFYFAIEGYEYLAKENASLYKYIKNFKLNLSDKDVDENTKKNINFHTKARVYTDKKNYNNYINTYSNFLSNLKISELYDINILGEKYVPSDNFEVIGSTALITSIYPYLINLEKNNIINDLTIDYFIDNLDYNKFLDEIKLIANAEYNICFGGGGSTCFSVIFGKNNTILLDKDSYNIFNIHNYTFKNNKFYLFNEINSYIKFIGNNICHDKIVIDTLKPYLGLGDLLIVKQKTIQNNIFIKNMIISLPLIKQYRSNYEPTVKVLKQRLNLLFNGTNFIYDENDEYHDCKFSLLQDEFVLNKFINVYDYLTINNINNNHNLDNYIIFHTKIRFCTDYMIDFNKYIKPIVINFFLHFKTNKTIVILGERIIEKNLCSESLNIISIYDELLFLKNNNNVLDLTHEILYTGHEDINDLLHEINLISDADCNICFSIGGQFCLSFSFSKKFISFFPKDFMQYISKFDLNYNDMHAIIKYNNNSVFTTIYDFINKIDDEYSIVPRNYLTQYKIEKDAYFIGHNGLGDNITNLSAISYLSNFYKKIYFICKDFYFNNVTLLFSNIQNVEVVPIESIDEFNNIKNLYDNVIDECDFFVSGFCHTHYIKSKITNPYLCNYQPNCLDNNIYFNHIAEFYKDINLDLSIYYGFFNLPSLDRSLELYNSIKEYKICLLQKETSDGILFNYSESILNLGDEYIIIDINNNFYESSKENNLTKYELASQFLNIEIIYYIDTIQNADKIHITDSCLSSIVYPLSIINKLNTDDITIIDRKTKTKIQI